MDIRMPIKWFWSLRKIKVFRPELPVIAQTAYSFEDKEKNMKMGFVDCITKPLDKEKSMRYWMLFLLKFINKMQQI
jgi:CheY-like chemotaxis protein